MNNGVNLIALMPLGIFILGLIRIRNWQDPILLVVFLFLIAFLVEIIGLTKFFENEIRIIISNLFAFIYVILILSYYCLTLKKRNRLSISTLILTGVAILLLIVFSFWIDQVINYPHYAWQVGSLIVVVFSCCFLILEGRDLSSRIWMKDLFWIALANIIYTSGSLLDFSVRFYAIQLENPFRIFKILFIQTFIINIITYSLILKGIWEAGRKT
jgi:heme/copper-type cytochrome/quinol oxidase subunit 4